MRQRIALALILGLLASAIPPAELKAQGGVPVSLSAHGLPGLANVPVAADLPVGWAEMSYNTRPNFDLWQGRATSQYNVHFAFSLFERVMLSVRGTEAPSAVPVPPTVLAGGPDFTVTKERTHLQRDLSPSAHVLLLREGPMRPSVAIGGSDIAGANTLFESKYLIASKPLFDQLRLTAGYGLGPDLLDGPLAGVEWAPTRHLTLLGEYDARQLNGGLRLMPFPERWVADGIPRPTVDLFWGEGDGVSWGLTVRTPMDRDVVDREGELRWAKGPQRKEGMPLENYLTTPGFENVRVGRDGNRLTVAYENRVFNQHELDGLARVLEAASLAPGEFDSVRVHLRQVDRPVLQLDLAREDLRGFLEGELRGKALSEGVAAGFADGESANEAASGALHNPSRFKLDLVLRPQLQTAIFQDINVADGRISLLPNALLELASGTKLDVQYLLPIDQTNDFVFIGGRLPDPQLDRALLHHARPLHSEPSSTLWAQWSAGRFTTDHVGVRQETALYLNGGALLLATDAAWIGTDYDDLNQAMVTGTARYLFPQWDTRVSLTGGRFLFEDWAAVGDLSRFYGDTEIGLFLKHSETGSQAGIRIALPLTFSRDLKPYRIRPRLPERWQYTQQSTVFQESNFLRSDIARTLPMAHSLENVYFDRDRLLPVMVKRDLGKARFWRK